MLTLLKSLVLSSYIQTGEIIKGFELPSLYFWVINSWKHKRQMMFSIIYVFRGMLRRPNPTDSEEDLLKEQERFLTSGSPAAASVVRRPDKRRGEAGGGPNGKDEVNQRDVVTIEGQFFQTKMCVFCLLWFNLRCV